jgi:hypothetical protein
LIGLPLVAHLTIHWSLTDAGDDPCGKLFAKVREGLDKWLGRRGAAFAGIWARERQSAGQSDVVHCHLLFYLPVEYRSGKKLAQVRDEIYELVGQHGGNIWHEKVIDLRVHDNPDGKYLIKGGDKKVWQRFRVRKEHRRLQGLIHGKRCGTTENIGAAARNRWKSAQDRKQEVRERRTALLLPDDAEATNRRGAPRSRPLNAGLLAKPRPARMSAYEAKPDMGFEPSDVC